MREVFFHEDDYCQIEILPLSNLDFCLHQAGLIDDFSEEHKSGEGFDDIYIREEHPSDLLDFNITTEEIRKSLSKILPEYDKVYTGYSLNHRELCPNLLAFGREKEEAIFVQVNDENIVKTIWCGELMEEILHLPKSDELIVADWTSGIIFPLSEKAKIKDLVKKREAEYLEYMKKFNNDNLLKESPTPKVVNKWWKFWK